MNTRDLEYFLAAAELRHFGQAAERCCVSQPTLSGQIKKFEETLGVTLFERTSRRVMLTETGEKMARAARRVLREVDAMDAVAQGSRDPMAGNFRLGGFPTLASYVFPGLVPRIRRAMPKLRLILIEEKTDELIEKIRIGDIDAALLSLPVSDSSLMVHELFDDEFMLAVPVNHELARCQSIDKSILNEHPILLLEEGHCLRNQALEFCELNETFEEHDFRATSMETLRLMVKAETGITFIPTIAVDEDDSGICFIPFNPPAPARRIGLVWRKSTVRDAAISKIALALGDLAGRR